MKKEKQCLQCGEVFSYQRFDSKYCSQKCRQAAYKDRSLGRVRVNPENLSQSEKDLRQSIRSYSNYDRLSIAVLIKLRKQHPKNDDLNSTIQSNINCIRGISIDILDFDISQPIERFTFDLLIDTFESYSWQWSSVPRIYLPCRKILKVLDEALLRSTKSSKGLVLDLKQINKELIELSYLDHSTIFDYLNSV